MARRLYFAFHYEDVKNFRVNVVRNSWLTKPDRESAGYFDASLWEKVKKEGDLAIKRMINKGMKNSSVTAVLAGTKTYSRPWVRYEILNSFRKGNGMMTVFIHKIKGKDKIEGKKGANPLDFFYFRINDNTGKVGIWEWDIESKKWEFLEYIPLNDVRYNFGKLKEGQFSKLFPSYDWINDDGYKNFSVWIEVEAARAGR